MFENSFLSRISIKCREHFNNKISHICVQAKCQGHPLLCKQCLQSSFHLQRHYGHQLNIRQINLSLDEICQTIKKQNKPIENLYKIIISEKQNQNLLKWQQQKQQHFLSIQNHLNTLKYQIEEEIKNIVQKFQAQLLKQKQIIYSELQKYYDSYRERFIRFSKLTQPIVMMNQSFKYYDSKNTLIIKLLSDDPKKIGKWFNDLKLNLKQSQMAVKNIHSFQHDVKRIGLTTNQIMDELPRIRNTDYQNQLPNILRQNIKTIFKSYIQMRRSKIGNPNTVLRSTSMNFIPQQSHQNISSIKGVQMYKKQIRPEYTNF